MGGPLHGITVIEVGNFITGPYAGQLLADLGAKVIKIEAPQSGDPFRSWNGGLYSPHYIAYNRSKLSLTLNLKNESARHVLYQLIDKSDVFIENFRPGVADRLGIGYREIHERNSALIYCSISGMGQDGPYAGRPSFDTVGQALSGMLGLLIDPDNPRPMGPAFSDGLTGIFAAYGILGAIISAMRTGVGQRVSTSMMAATVGFLLEPFSSLFTYGKSPGPFGRREVSQVFVFRCSDGRLLSIHLSTPPKFWIGLTEATMATHLQIDKRFVTRPDRVRNYDMLDRELAPIFLGRSREDWVERLATADVPFAPVLSLEEVLDDPQVQHLGLHQTVQHPREGQVRLLSFPVSYDTTPLEASTAPPTLSEHTETLLAELGYTEREVAQLRSEGAI